MDHRKASLRDEEVIQIYRTMYLARKLDERQWMLNRTGKIPFVISCQGHEAAQVGAAWALQAGSDAVLPYYRDLGVVLTLGVSPRDIMLAAFAKAEDPSSGGRQMPNHFSDPTLNIFTQSSPTGSQIPHAVGFAWAFKVRGEQKVAFVSFGDGTSNQGDFHEGLNFAGVHRLPVLAFVENNTYAISVPYHKQVASKTIAERAQSYGMEGVLVDGSDPFLVYEAVKNARERALEGLGGTLIEARVSRLVPHSSDDDDRTYRDQKELEEEKARDALGKMRTYILDKSLIDDAALEQLEKDVMDIVNDATAYAERAPYADPSTVKRYVYAEAE
ncbi:MAG: thiamine pyrophosphate-dependent dehydrogenase E1 component subunit alpha [Candidatus Carbobacillus altaicus]|uniref:2-oxoisovalerate dehydrogenase subunit alpha n=1 Tax=Candidatus Carbonibacillus altaicus TaxID=2163959 RepID=A0A2R6Y370_9BACL|nr:thiamine pyrophosphate-dependent dehydrogenase E1 component subunit alpha [Candidatus Carbobacillus altaicus]PTQ57130.1 MAG: Branched-chain alpha-keto acid dehydrogenase, E1 component, alpha subunit [Candidatus Carbobacillus altaicus]